MLGSTVDTCSCVSPTMNLVFGLKRTWDQKLSSGLLLTFKRNPAPCLVRQWIRVPASVPCDKFGHPSFEMSRSFLNQVLAHFDLLRNWTMLGSISGYVFLLRSLCR